MIPDKICVPAFTDSYEEDMRLEICWYEDRCFDAESWEDYIRKEALLKWANDEIKRLKQGCKEKWLDGKVLYGGVLAMQNLIDKLNSM